MLSTDLLAHYRQISQQLLTVVDVETTGHQPRSSRVTEISVLQGRLGEGILQQQTSLINPEIPIPDAIVRFTGITSDMVADAPIAREVLQNYRPVLMAGVLTAHNLSFDYGFLQAEYGRFQASFERPKAEQFCTVELSRLMLADLPSRSLPDLVQHFQFAVGRSHRAEADAQACWMLAERLLTEIQTEADETLLHRFGQQWIPLKVAAPLLGDTQAEGRSRLEAANIPFRLGRGTSGSPLYRRKDVERVVAETGDQGDRPARHPTQEATQLSLWG